MDSDQQTEAQIFDAAIQIDDPAARSAFLDQKCGADATLRASVEELLACHDTAGDFLETPVKPRGSDNGAEQPGAIIGRYRLIEQIGEGGFGAVYRAEQLEPVRRDVALKIIKPGMGSREIIGRFEAERQALAMMSHPNIATVLDAGTTAAGRPYFVMELVDGRPLDEFCDARRLSVQDRLKLFLQVCRAVQHAHHKGIVHRDLKPSNVLVAANDAGTPAVPKVIDFGIAKAIRQPASMSITGDRRSLMGTLEFMSPEQVAGGHDIDTRADIYALGGMLYKLLTGVTPLDADSMSQRGFDEICRAIREIEPSRPSARLYRIDRLTDVALDRGTQPAALRRTLRGDLDWIVGKALEKDRSRRYETASELAGDIERHLNNQPVTAGPPSAWYWVGKFVRRNRIAVAAVASVSIAIVAGGAAATIGFVRAEHQRREADIHRERAEFRRQEAETERQAAELARARADAEADKANRAVVLLEQMLGAAHPDQGHPADYTVRQLLNDFSESESTFDSLAGQPEVEARLRRTIGRAYWHLGDMIRAGSHLERALELRRAIHGPAHPLVVESHVDFARYLMLVSRFNEAQAAAESSLDALRSANPSDEHIWAMVVLWRVHDVNGRYSAAEEYLRQALEISQSLHGERHATTLSIRSFFVLPALQRRQWAKAEALARETIELQTEVLGPDHNDVAFTQCLLGMALHERGSLAEAERVLRRALETHRRQLGADSSHVVRALVPLASVLRDLRRPAEAERVALEAVDIVERVTMDREFHRVRAYRTLGIIVRAKDPGEAAANWQKAIEAQRAIAADRPIITDLLNRRAAALRELGKLSEAEDDLREALAISRGHPDEDPGPEIILYNLANTLRQRGKFDAAEPLFREAAETCDPTQLVRPLLWLDWIDVMLELGQAESAAGATRRLEQFAEGSRSVANRSTAEMARAMILTASGDLATAEPLIQSASESARSERVARAVGRVECLRADLFIRQARFDEAERLLLTLDRAARAQVPFQIDDVLLVTRLLVKLYEAWDRPDEAARWRDRPVAR